MTTPLSNLTILVVDDDADSCYVLRSALEQAGAAVLVAQSVGDAIDTFRRCPPHAVVADIRLGNSDGCALIKAIREHNLEYRGFTLAIAVTGFASPEDEERAICAGFDVYLPKPVDPTVVVDGIAGFLRGPTYMAA
jgi:CheY-like chemotaxis protein